MVDQMVWLVYLLVVWTVDRMVALLVERKVFGLAV
jgi:hypothetical protein